MLSVSLPAIVRAALLEDVGPGDLTTFLTVSPDIRTTAYLAARSELVVSGLTAARETYRQVDANIRFEALVADGDLAPAGARLARLEGPAAAILTAERVSLNFLMRLSGVATLTRTYLRALDNPNVFLADTRKTSPGLRALEKEAVRHGGGRNHRFGLYDGILIKDNHLAAAGGMARAVDLARTGAPHTLRIEVEVDNEAQLQDALEAGVDLVLLDNFTPERLRAAVRLCEKFFAPGPRRVLLEASGGINLSTIQAVGQSGVDIVSVGALTHSAPAADVGLDFVS